MINEHKMKKKIFTVLTGASILLAACQKDSSAPQPAAKDAATSTTTTQKSTSSITTASSGSVANDTTKGYLRVEMIDPAVAALTDDIILEFSPASTPVYSPGYDARTFPGTAGIGLSSLSSDGVPLAINELPLQSIGTTIPLVVDAKSTGVYKLNLTAVNAIPSNINIWLKDKQQKDSLDFRLYPSYSFNINTADSTTYGKSRFSVVLRAKQ